MLRRFFVLALVATACAPTHSPEEKPNPEPPKRGVPGTPLLALANWSAPVAGWSQSLAIYEDGLLELRSFEDAPVPGEPFGRELRVRMLRVPSSQLDPLRGSLGHKGFEACESYYHEDGVHDGGALTIADMATHRRRVTVVNRPSKLPDPVAAARTMLDDLANRVNDTGHDGFDASTDSIEVIHMFTQDDESRELTVYGNGLLELRTTYTSNAKAHEAADYPTPTSATRQAVPNDLEALRAATAALPSTPPKIERAARTRDLLFVGSAKREFVVAREPSPEMIAVLSALEAMAESVDAN